MRTTAIARLTLATAILACAPFARSAPCWPRAGTPPVAAETTATAIPGVIAAGTKVEVIKSGFTGTEGPIGLPDGSLIFTETQANRITRIDANNQTSTFLENTNGSNGLAFDAKGRLISVQTTPGKTLDRRDLSEGPGSDALRQLRRQAVRPPERSRRRQERRRLFHRAGTERHTGAAAADAAALAGRLLRPARRQGDQDRRRHRAAERHHAEPRREDALRQQHQRRVPARVRREGRRHASATAATSRSIRRVEQDAGAAASTAAPTAWRSTTPAASTSSRLGGVHVFSPKGDLLGTIPLSLRARTSRSPVPTRRRSTSSAAAPRSRCGCWPKGSRGGRSNADLRIRLQRLRQGIRGARAVDVAAAVVPGVQAAPSSRN